MTKEFDVSRSLSIVRSLINFDEIIIFGLSFESSCVKFRVHDFFKRQRDTISPELRKPPTIDDGDLRLYLSKVTGTMINVPEFWRAQFMFKESLSFFNFKMLLIYKVDKFLKFETELKK